LPGCLLAAKRVRHASASIEAGAGPSAEPRGLEFPISPDGEVMAQTAYELPPLGRWANVVCLAEPESAAASGWGRDAAAPCSKARTVACVASRGVRALPPRYSRPPLTPGRGPDPKARWLAGSLPNHSPKRSSGPYQDQRRVAHRSGRPARLSSQLPAGRWTARSIGASCEASRIVLRWSRRGAKRD
jgi:hypothetical protein